MVGWFMVFNTTFNTILSCILAVSFIGGGNWRKPPTCRQSLTNFYHIMFYFVWAGFKLTLVVIGTDCIHVGGYKSNYHTITTTMIWIWYGFFSYAIKKILFYQSQFPDVDDNEIKEMDIRITKLTELVQSKQEENRKLDTGKESFIINMYISNLMYFNLGTVKMKRF
jgi:hypothetical protein